MGRSIERARGVDDQPDRGFAVAAAGKAVQHPLGPRAARNRGRGQLEYGAVLGIAAVSCRAVKGARGVEDQAAARSSSVRGGLKLVQRAELARGTDGSASGEKRR